MTIKTPVHVFEGKDGQHYFHVKGGNGEIIAQSEGYVSETNARRGYSGLVRNMLPDSTRYMLLIMFNGWKLREDSYQGDGKYGRDEVDCMIEAAGGDQLLGMLLSTFDHWGNDIMSIAAHYGLSYKNDNGTITIREDVPPAPSELHWWDYDVEDWRPPLDPEEDAAAGLVPDSAAPAPLCDALATVTVAKHAVESDGRRGRRLK